jgi:hypothetical protein
MKFIQFYIDDREAVGMDGVHYCDGRWGLMRCMDEGHIRAHALRHVQPHYTGFRIMSGPRFSSARPVSPMVSLV